MLLSGFILVAYFSLFILSFRCIHASENTTLKKECPEKNGLYIAVGVLIFRILLALFTDGLNTDMNCWRAWSSRAATVGPWGFYTDDYFCDYPPGYIYILTIIGFFRNIFTVLPSTFDTLLLKFPAILCDVLLCGLLYRKTAEETANTRLSILVTLLYAFNPAIWMNSAVWGQVDAIFTLFIILSLIDLKNKNYLKSTVLLSIAVVIKPQALMFAPIYLLTIWENRKMEKFGKQLLLAISGFILPFVLLVVPFSIGKSPFFIFDLYGGTLASYPYASVNAFNLAALFGGNWISIDTVFMGLTFGTWGYIGITLSILLSSLIFLKGKDDSRYFYAAALLISGIFVMGSKMHERYLFPAIALMFLAYIHKRDKRILISTCALSVLHFGNVYYVYLMHQKGIVHLFPPDIAVSLISFLTTIAFLYAVYLGISLYVGIPAPSKLVEKKESSITRKDVLIILLVCVLYAVAAFTNLGHISAPQTVDSTENIADFNEQKTICSASVYKGIGDCNIHFSFSYDGQNWSEPLTYEGSDCFKWERYDFSVTARYAKVYASGTTNALYEVAFFDENQNLVPLSSDGKLFDEQSLAQYNQSYLNSTYFDEIYHARTAYEHIENVPGHYENTHPPLGKHIIGLGIRLFGMNPFGWRFMGTLAGVLMLPLMYLLGKKLFKSTFFATCAILLMTFDFMHFSQTRIATIDSYPVLFIMTMYFFMYLFFEKAETLTRKKSCLYLGLSGLFFGFAIASKWIGFYGGAGLAVLFFIALWRRVKEKGYKELLLCLLCILFFVAVPFLIYYASYIPIHIADGAESFWENFWRYQKHMFTYHSQLDAEHPFSSMWYTWPFVIRPIWYYGDASLRGTGMTSSIVGMGNPLLWWTSLVTVIACIILTISNIKKKQKENQPLFLSIGYLSQLIPWMLVSRVVFIYHYFASLPFALLTLVYGFKNLCEKCVWGKRAVIGFMACACVLFILFYPVLSGTKIPSGFITSALQWFDSWVLGYQ